MNVFFFLQWVFFSSHTKEITNIIIGIFGGKIYLGSLLFIVAQNYKCWILETFFILENG